MKEKIIFDTDLGSDIDDSFALAYLLHHSKVDLLGVTTVSGEPEARADLCQILIDEAHKNIPVYVGIENPITEQHIYQPECQMKTILKNYDIHRSEQKENAVDFMIRSARENKGEVTLIGVGPYSNIAAAINKDPDFSHNLKRVVIMGCKLEREKIKNVLDWNILCDQQAGNDVLNADFRELTIFPCDLTNTIFTPSEYLKSHVHGEFAHTLNEMGNNWFARGAKWYHYHDPMAAVYCLHPELFSTESGYMSISIQDSLTSWEKCEHGTHHLAIKAGRDAFLKELYFVVNDAHYE